MLLRTSVFKAAGPTLATSHSVGGKKAQDVEGQTMLVQKPLLCSGMLCFIKFQFKPPSNLYSQYKNADSNSKL